MHECLKVFRHNVSEYLARKACFNTSVFLVFYSITDAFNVTYFGSPWVWLVGMPVVRDNSLFLLCTIVANFFFFFNFSIFVALFPLWGLFSQGYKVVMWPANQNSYLWLVFLWPICWFVMWSFVPENIHAQFYTFLSSVITCFCF